MKKSNIKNLIIFPTLALCLTLTGCEKELATNTNSHIDIIDTTNDELVKSGITQELDVPYNNFKLVVDYKCNLGEDEKWTITSDKSITTEIHTEGLDDSVNVYIDNIHTDTSVVSHYPKYDGIMQDTMDDRIHNSLMKGFPISDNTSYVGINKIEGQNDTFISGFSSSYSGSVEQRRRVESDYVYTGAVYGNKISSVIDLIIDDNGETQCVSVPSEILVSCWPYIAKVEKGEVKYYHYYFDQEENSMKKEVLSDEDYQKVLHK